MTKALIYHGPWEDFHHERTSEPTNVLLEIKHNRETVQVVRDQPAEVMAYRVGRGPLGCWVH